jgi:hypothetical protein
METSANEMGRSGPHHVRVRLGLGLSVDVLCGFDALLTSSVVVGCLQSMLMGSYGIGGGVFEAPRLTTNW